MNDASNTGLQDGRAQSGGPLQNRCDPFGQLHAVAARGGMMGNRGGRFHSIDRTLGKRRFASKRWICCVCDFKDRKRTVWGNGYTELFFLDEVTALAAGHRPCFECRRVEAQDFAGRFWQPGVTAPKADAMDLILHRDRIAGWNGERRKVPIKTLPAGTMIAFRNKAYAIGSNSILEWSFDGYTPAIVPQDILEQDFLEQDFLEKDILAELLTPPPIVNALRNGYRPQWHFSASS